MKGCFSQKKHFFYLDSGLKIIMDPDPVCNERLDPDPGPDLVNIRPDPKP